MSNLNDLIDKNHFKYFHTEHSKSTIHSKILMQKIFLRKLLTYFYIGIEYLKKTFIKHFEEHFYLAKHFL